MQERYWRLSTIGCASCATAVRTLREPQKVAPAHEDLEEKNGERIKWARCGARGPGRRFSRGITARSAEGSHARGTHGSHRCLACDGFQRQPSEREYFRVSRSCVGRRKHRDSQGMDPSFSRTSYPILPSRRFSLTWWNPAPGRLRMRKASARCSQRLALCGLTGKSPAKVSPSSSIGTVEISRGRARSKPNHWRVCGGGPWRRGGWLEPGLRRVGCTDPSLE